MLILRFLFCTTMTAALAGCGSAYSPDTHAGNAVRQAAKADQGVVVVVREVAGGLAGAQAGAGPVGAFTTLADGLLAGLASNAAEHALSDTKAFEYIVRKPNGNLVSVTQKDTVPLSLGQKVLVVAGNQARVVPDDTVAVKPLAKNQALIAFVVAVRFVPLATPDSRYAAVPAQRRGEPQSP